MSEHEDVEFEAENNEPPKGGDAEKKITKLKEELEQVKKEKQEYMDGWQRSKADYVNLLKRLETETRGAKRKGLLEAVEKLLPAFDALERAKEHGEIPEGFTAIAKQLESAFGSFGLTPVGVVGEAFDPAVHEAFGQDKTESSEKDNQVTAVLEKGWKIDDAIIRAAKVRVGHFEG